MTLNLLSAIEAALAHFGGVVEKDASVVVHLPGTLWADLKAAYEEHLASGKVMESRLATAAGAALTETAQKIESVGGTTVQFNAGVAGELQAAHAELATAAAPASAEAPAAISPPPGAPAPSPLV